MQHATVRDEAQKLLNLNDLKAQFPTFPEVVALEVEDYVDFSGDPALRVWVILRDGTDDASLTGEAVMQIKSAIHRMLLEHKIEEFPYIFLATETEKRQSAVN